MCCSGGGRGAGMTRCGLLCGMAALAALGAALLGPAWLVTEERLPQLPRGIAHRVSVRFRLGLFQACPSVQKEANVTEHIPSPPCTKIRYENFDDVNATELGFQSLEFTPIVISKMRISTPFQVAAAALILTGTISALIGHCCSDHRTLVACGLFLLGGLSLGGGLIVLASALSEASWNLPQSSYFSKSTEEKSLPQYRYGWCLQLSGLALILSELAALLTISGYMARFPTVEDMVRVMVPGAERKLREQRGLSSEYLVRTHQKSPGPTPCTGVNQSTKVQVNTARVAEEGTSLLCKTAPDICASNPQSAISYVDKADLSHVLPAYPDTKIIDATHYVDGKLVVDASGVVDSRLSGFVDKEGLVIAFAEGKDHASCQEPPARFSDFPLPSPNESLHHQQSVQQQQSVQHQQSVQQRPPSAFADKEAPNPDQQQQQQQQQLVDSLLDAPYGYDTRYNSLAGHTVPITLKHQHAPASPQYVYQNFGTIHSGVLRVAEPGQGMMNPAAAGQTAHRGSMTLQNPKRKLTGATAHIAQNTFSTLECERRGSKRGAGPGGGGGGVVRSEGNGPLQPGLKNNFCAGSAV